jgi:hypothetical protein
MHLRLRKSTKLHWRLIVWPLPSFNNGVSPAGERMLSRLLTSVISRMHAEPVIGRACATRWSCAPSGASCLRQINPTGKISLLPSRKSLLELTSSCP